MAETPIRPFHGNNSGTPLPPGTVQLFPNTPEFRITKRGYNNRNTTTPMTNTPYSKLQRRITINDYNPN